MKDSRFLDSSAWLSYFYGQNQVVKSLVESRIMLRTSALSLFEVKKKLASGGTQPERLNASLAFMRKRSVIVVLDAALCEFAADLSRSRKLGAIDALIYASALRAGSVLVTLDSDFAGLEDVEIL